MVNEAYKWMTRGLAGLVTMIEGETRVNVRIDAATHQTLTMWLERLRTAIERMRPQ